MNWNNLKETLKLKKQRAKVKVCYCVNSAMNWASKNPQIVIAAIPVVTSVVTFGVKNGVKHMNLRKAEKVKQEYCYDPSLGHYWELKRKLSNQEWVRIEKRKQEGEKLGDILSSLNVLK